MGTKTTNLIFWILIRIYSNPGLVQEVRDEVRPFAKASQPPEVFGIPEPARLEINDAGLVRSCPLLKACLYECLRLHSKPVSMRLVQKDLTIFKSRDEGQSFEGEQPQSFVLEAGDFVASLSNAHPHDPHHYESANSFRPGRFLRSGGCTQEQRTFFQGALKPWGLGECACPGRVLAEQEVLAFVAAILVLWDLEPVDSQGWIMPRHKTSAVVSLPAADIRARLRPISL